jgi:hypothetical protein
METTFTPDLTEELFGGLRTAGQEFDRCCPGDPLQRQPVHTVYGGAHLFKPGTIEKVGSLARRYFATYSPDAAQFAEVFGLTVPKGDGESGGGLARRVYDRVADKLNREPVEDFRIDFEDGYGHRPPAEEDAHAEACALAVAREMAAGALPPFFGIRIRSLRDESNCRQGRTLDIFLTTLARATDGCLPQNFVVTLPKVTLVREVAGLVTLFEFLEANTGIAAGSLKLEIMVESPHTLVDPWGRLNLPLLTAAAGGRCVAAHFGAYDFTAAIGVVAARQHLGHPACDFARLMMQTALAGTGIRLTDGATLRLPVEPHRTPADGSVLTDEQIKENRRAVHGAWRESYLNIHRSLDNGLYQGWDLHPSQLPVRYAATYAFFLEQKAAVGRRLKAFVEQAARAIEQGGIFDDAATGQGMLNFFLRGINCGAFAEEDTALAGLSLEEIRTRSFAAIVAERCR